jgi:hypothetical protein
MANKSPTTSHDETTQSMAKNDSIDMDQSNSTQTTNEDREQQTSCHQDQQQHGQEEEETAKRKRNSRRTINLGLDGNYWHGLIKSEPNVNSEVSDDKPKRTRRTVDRFSIDLLNSSSSTMGNEFDFDRHSHSSHATASPTTTQSCSNTKFYNNKQRRVIYNARTYLAVRNEENGFFLCRLINRLYEDTKKSKIEWLELIENNKYEVSFVDWLDPLSIIRPVRVTSFHNPQKVRKTEENLLYSISDEDLEKIERKLKEAIEGVAFVSDTDSESMSTTTSSSSLSMDHETEVKGATTNKEKQEFGQKNDDLFSIDDENSRLEQTSDKSPSTATKSTIVSPSQSSANTKTFLEKKLENVKSRVMKQVAKHEKKSSSLLGTVVDKTKRVKRLPSDSSESDDNTTANANKKCKTTASTSSASSTTIPVKSVFATITDRMPIKKPIQPAQQVTQQQQQQSSKTKVPDSVQTTTKPKPSPQATTTTTVNKHPNGLSSASTSGNTQNQKQAGSSTSSKPTTATTASKVSSQLKNPDKDPKESPIKSVVKVKTEIESPIKSTNKYSSEQAKTESNCL